jgi:hypothetical protein
MSTITRVALLTFPSLDIINLPVMILDSHEKGEDTIYNIELPDDHPSRFRRWDAWGTQYVREILLNDTLEQLFFNGPTYDGDMVSKSQRDEMTNLGLVCRYDGYQTLTDRGLEICMRLGLDRAKEKRARQRAERRAA